MRQHITTIHEGIDTDLPPSRIPLAGSMAALKLSRKDEVITYVARSLEPYRGFHSFMRALPEIQRRRPRAQAVILGNDGISYGPPAAPGTTYRETLLAELGDRLDPARVHFLGQLPYAGYLDVCSRSPRSTST